MSAPNTNIDKQQRRHKGPLIGMIVVVIFALGLFTYWLMYEAAGTENPVGEGQTELPASDVQDGAVSTPNAPATDPVEGTTAP